LKVDATLPADLLPVGSVAHSRPRRTTRR